MRRTRIGVLLLTVGWASFAIALIVESLAPAFLGLVLLAVVFGQRVPPGSVQAQRHAPVEVLEGEPFDITFSATIEGRAPIRLNIATPPTVDIIEVRSEAGRGEARLSLRVVARQAGLIVWSSLTATIQDEWGLVEQEVALPLRHLTRVAPGPQAFATGRAAGKIQGEGQRSRRADLAERDPEIDRLRDHIPGDRVRDIDWVHSAVLDKLITREMARQSNLPVVVLMQATSSVRWMRRVSKLQTLRLTALGIMAAAQNSGLATGLVAYDDRRVTAQVRVSASRTILASALQSISEMHGVDPVDAVTARASVRMAPESAPTSAERAFLQAIARFDPASPRGLTPVEAALAAVARVCSQPALVVCLLDAEETPTVVETVVQRLKRLNHRCVVAIPASGMHHYHTDEVDEDVLASLVAWRRNREQAAMACKAMRVPFLVLGDQVDASTIREVIRSAD